MRTAALIAAGMLLFGMLSAAAWVCWPLTPPAFVQVVASFASSDAYLLDRHGEVVDRERIDFDVRRLEWVHLTDISPALTAAMIDAEDRNFWQHRGVNWISVVGAMRDEMLRHRRRGASTITMQVASILQQRSRQGTAMALLAGKLAQARFALSLEEHWSKQQILEAYLNLLTYRGELQGVAAAADRLAGKTPASLSLAESLVLAALPPAPDAEPSKVATRSCARAASRQVPINCDTLRRTATEMLETAHTTATDRLAPQLAHALLKWPGQRLATTLDATLQRKARDTLRNHLTDLAARNVRDCAALIVDNDSGEVLAYVGSGGPNSRAEQVDGVRALRQAGSTLKPFLYELALERRYLTAASLLQDSPLNLDTTSGVYLPQDYDHVFKGPVSVRTALAGSLNVPAVRTLVLVGIEPFRTRLKELGYEAITQDGEYYGYSLALGSAEVTLWEQAQAYRTLARGGQFTPLTIVPRRERFTDRRELPADASYIVADILSDRASRSVTFGLDNHLNTAFWSAAKTGTSKDMRDNWCIGFSRRYTVAVWVGNFEGDSMHNVSGVTGAAPIWHDLISAVQEGADSSAPDVPDHVSASRIRFLPAVEPPRREWFLDGTATNEVIAVAEQGLVARVASPANGMVIALDPDVPAARQRVPISVRGAKANMTLKLNDEPLGAADKTLMWTPRPGRYRLTLEDERGRAIDRVLFTVRGG
jgi:penicillin-binding protein 1C